MGLTTILFVHRNTPKCEIPIFNENRASEDVCGHAADDWGSRGRESNLASPTKRSTSSDLVGPAFTGILTALDDADHKEAVWVRATASELADCSAPSSKNGPRAGRSGPDGAHAPAGIRASGRPVGWRAAMWLATCSASLPTPPISTEANAYWKYIPMKYRPGSESLTPRSCTGSPSSLKTGRLIHRKSGANPVHQITFATSRICPPSRTGLPSRTPAVLGTSSTLAAVRSCRLIRARGMPLDRNVLCTFRPTGVRTVRTCMAANHIRGVTNLSGPLPGRTGSCPVSLPDSQVW